MVARDYTEDQEALDGARILYQRDGCLNCGSPNVHHVEGDYDSGVRGPNGEREILRESGYACADCGACEDRLGTATASAAGT